MSEQPMYHSHQAGPIREFRPENRRVSGEEAGRTSTDEGIDDTSCMGSHQPRLSAPEFAFDRSMTDTLNLTTHRAAASVWDRRGWDGTREQLTATRWLLGIGGGALALQGLRQRSVAGSLLAGLGGAIAWWALTGEGDLSDARRHVTHLIERAGWRTEDLVHDASADSFPASDAPAWTPTVGTGLSGRARQR